MTKPVYNSDLWPTVLEKLNTELYKIESVKKMAKMIPMSEITLRKAMAMDTAPSWLTELKIKKWLEKRSQNETSHE